jgi:hypothetical protein
MNFGRRPQAVPGHGRRLLLATDDGADLREDGSVALPALSGALVEGVPTAAPRRPSAGAAL